MAAACLLLLGIAYGFRATLLAPLLRSQLQELAAVLDLQLTVGKISGNYLTTIKLSDISAKSRTPASPPIELEIGQVRLNYSLFDLLHGSETLLNATTVRLDHVRLSIDLRNETSENSPASLAILPTVLPNIIIRDASFTFQDSAFATTIEGISMANERRPADQAPLPITFSATAARITEPVSWQASGPLTGRLLYGENLLTIPLLTIGPDTVTENTVIDFQEPAKGLPAFNGDLQIFAGRLRVDGSVQDTLVETRLIGTDLDLGQITALWQPEGQSWGGRLSGSFNLRIDTDKPEAMEGMTTLELTDGRLADFPVQKVAVQAMAGNGVLRFDQFDGQLGDNALRITECTVPLAVMAGRFSLTSSDLPQLLAAAGMRDASLPEPTPRHDLALSGQLADGRLSLTKGEFSTEAAIISLARAEITMPTSSDMAWAAMPLTSDLTAHVANLASLAAILSLPPMTGAVNGHLTLSGAFDNLAGQAVFEASKLTVREHLLGDFQMEGHATDSTIFIDSFAGVNRQDRIAGAGVYLFAEKKIKEMHAELSIGEVADYLDLFVSQKIDLQGRLHASLTAEGSLDRPIAALNCQLSRARLASLPMDEALLSLHAADGQVIVEQAQIKNAKGAVSLSGGLASASDGNRFTGRLRTLQVTVGRETMALTEESSLVISQAGQLIMDSLPLHGAPGTILISGSLAAETESPIRNSVSDNSDRRVRMLSASLKAL